MGAHNIKLPYYNRNEYGGSVAGNVGTFATNTLGSIYNGVASTWNEAMEGKTAGQMAQEGDRDMETTLNDISKNGPKMEHVENLAAAAIVRKTVRGSNKLSPNKDASGDHTSFDRDVNGNIYKYETYEKTKSGHFNPTKRFDGGQKDGTPGDAHTNKNTGKKVTTPHVQGKTIPGSVRKPTPDEVPKNSRFKN